MTAKHTPGPWSVDGPPWDQIVWSSAENRVCFLAHSNGLDDDRDIATGRLIAAAPELLEALKAAIECGMVPISSVTDGGACKHSRQIHVADMIRAALAKVEGRS